MAENRLARRWATAAPYGSAARSAEKESPSNGFAVPAPLRQGGRGDGGADCHSQCTHWLRNDRVLREVRGKNPPVTASPCQPPLGKRAWGRGIATASVRTGFAMTGFPWSVVHGRRATARVAPTESYKECLAGGRTGASAPTGGVLMVPYAVGHMGPALQGVFVGQGPRALPGCATRSAGGVYRMCFKFVKKLSCLFGAVAVQCFRRFFASKFALHPG